MAAAEASLIDEALLVRGAHHKLPRNHSGVVVDGDPDLYTKLAKCCMPVPGDPIIGFVTRGEGISVHRTDCTNVASLRQMPERIVPVSWAPTADAAFLVAVQVEGIDRAGMLNDLTRVLSEMHMSIVSVSANASKDHVFTMRLTFQTPDPRHLETVLEQEFARAAHMNRPLSIAFITQYIVAGTHWVEAHLQLRVIRWIAVGLLLALGTGLGALFLGYPFLTSHTAHFTLPLLGEIYFASALFFDAGVFAAVVGSTLLILTALAHQSVRGHRRAPEKTVTATTGPRDVD